MTDQTLTRLDRHIRRLYPGINQGIVEKYIRTKKILVNGGAATSGTRIEASDLVTILVDLSRYGGESEKKTSPEREVSQADKEWMKSLIIWEDDELIVIDKPRGIAVQGGTGLKRHIDSLARAHNPEARLVHRIDKETSGILVMAKTLKMARYLTALFKERRVRKTYRAITEGSVNPAQGVIDLPLGKEDMGGGKEKIVVGGAKAKPAETQYAVVKKLGGKYSVVDCWPKSGRTHQLRVHLSESGWPILGDYKYGAKEKKHALCLHAFKLEFPHYDGGKIALTAPLSTHMKEIIERFGVDPDKL